jgi:hypothetical protein
MKKVVLSFTDKVPHVIIDKKLNGLDKVVLFPEKVEKAKKVIEKIGLPDFTKHDG